MLVHSSGRRYNLCRVRLDWLVKCVMWTEATPRNVIHGILLFQEGIIPYISRMVLKGNECRSSTIKLEECKSIVLFVLFELMTELVTLWCKGCRLFLVGPIFYCKNYFHIQITNSPLITSSLLLIFSFISATVHQSFCSNILLISRATNTFHW